MLDTIHQHLAGVSAEKDRRALRTVLNALGDRLSTQIFNTGGLAIKTGGSALAKTVNTVIAMCGGVYVSVVAVSLKKKTGLNIGAGKFNVAVFYVDAAGTVSVAFGAEGATAALVKFPQTPARKAVIGFLMITYASAFTGGTTPLDTATTVYVNTVGAFDPSVQLS